MLFVLSAVLFSVLVSVLLKLFPRWGVDTTQAVAWNYLVAAVLCWFMLAPPLQSLRSTQAPWAALLTLTAVLPSLFLVLGAAVRRIVRTDVERLSLLLSLLAAFTVWRTRRRLETGRLALA